MPFIAGHNDELGAPRQDRRDWRICRAKYHPRRQG